MIIVASQVHADVKPADWTQPDIEFIQASPERDLTYDDVHGSRLWQPLESGSPNFGYVTDTFWFRMAIPTLPAQQILEISYPHLDEITFYLLKDGAIVKRVVTGDRQPFAQRPLKHPHFVIPFQVSHGHRYQVMLKVETQGALQVPIRLWDQGAYIDHALVEDRLHSIYYGILITVIFFNLFIFLALRERMYLYYVLSTLGYLFLLSSLRGITYSVLWPGSPSLHNQAMLVSVPIAMVFALLFARSFLALHSKSRYMDRLVRTIIAANLLALAGTFLLDYNTSIRLSVMLAIPSCLLLTVIGPLQWVRGNPQAGFYTVAWGLLTVGSALTAANKYGVIPTNFISMYGMQIGSALEAILLTLALAARLYQEREDKSAAREAELIAMAARRKAELRMVEQALHNPLTGLPNRSCFELLLQDQLTREPQKRHAVGIIQLNNLQAITKTLGHRNTDRLLELTARRFNSIISELPGVWPIECNDRKTVHLASLESATFGFLMDATVVRQSPRQIIQCLEQLKEPIDYLGMQLPLDPLTGVSIYPDHADDTNALIRRAYIAQESDEARDRGLAYYQPELDSYSAERLTLASDLKQALQNNELALHYQPKLALASNTVVGMEALIRWPGRSQPLSADQIIAVAEQTGLIKPLTRWVLEHALDARDRFLERDYSFTLSVNISPNNLREPEFPLFVQRLMTSYSRHRGHIILEVTETSMMLDPVNSLRALRSLHATGIPLSIDDFGSGYSSLSYIKQLPASEIKIDRSLITDLQTQQEDRVIVQTTIDMCHSLGYQVVAEGVETEDTIKLLAAMGCDMIQGYVLTPPLPMADLFEWLDRQPVTAACHHG
nr:EAL domain-containing protein [Marinobacter caseinilyticus]